MIIVSVKVEVIVTMFTEREIYSYFYHVGQVSQTQFLACDKCIPSATFLHKSGMMFLCWKMLFNIQIAHFKSINRVYF